MKIVAPGLSLVCNIIRTKKLTKDIDKQNSKLMLVCSIMLVNCLIHSDYQILQHESQSNKNYPSICMSTSYIYLSI